MRKRILIFLLMFVLGPVGGMAGEERLDVANVDSDVRLHILSRTVNPEVIERYEYYEIKGNNEKELRREMTRNGTKWDDGKTYDSVTTWNVNWDYDAQCTSDGCRADAFKTVVNITFRFPKWTRTEDAPSGLIAKWDGYMKNLITHENGHRDMAVEAAADICKTVVELKPVRTKTELDREVKDVIHERMAKLDVDEKEYDATTVHGTTQGAVFP